MKVLCKTLEKDFLTIQYSEEAPGERENEMGGQGPNIFHLLLNLNDALDLMYRAGLIDGRTKRSEQLGKEANFFNTDVYWDLDERGIRTKELHELIEHLDEMDLYKIIKHSEYVAEYQKKGYAQMLADAKAESAALKSAILINREKIKAL